MDRIMETARKHRIPVIEDAAQALGASWKEQKVCTFGDIGCISFFPSKNLGGFGDAGMVVTNDPQLYEKMKMIVVHGSKERYHHEILGINSRLDTLQAALLTVKLKYLDEWNKARRRFAARYDTLLAELPVTVPKRIPDSYHIFHQYTLRVPRRDELAASLAECRIPHAIYYPIPLHLQKAFRSAGYREGSFPASEQAAAEVISLPMHTELTHEQMNYVAGTIRSFYSGAHGTNA
jgi:dTDP-4-amino-4,6-dideoxygalactose transaminase